VGPELTAIARRFTRREVLESILFPAHVVSDQYMSKKVLTLDGKIYVGLVSSDGGYLSIRDSKNNVTEIDETTVDQVLPNNSSIMPSGLLDSLTLREISDLLAYMGVIPSVEVARAKP
jgi:putative heme-binding domain-containing protein